MEKDEEVIEQPQDEIQEQDVQETPVAEPVAEGADAPEPDEDEDEDDDDGLAMDWTQYMPALQDVQAPQLDEQGTVDPVAYTEYVMAQAANRVNEQIRFAQSETRLWKEVEKAYPQVRKNPKQRDILHKLRIADVSTGGRGDLKEIAAEFFGEYEQARNEGRNAERTSVKVQQTASLARPSGEGVDTSSSDLQERLQSRDPRVASEARREALKAMMRSGKV